MKTKRKHLRHALYPEATSLGDLLASLQPHPLPHRLQQGQEQLREQGWGWGWGWAWGWGGHIWGTNCREGTFSRAKNPAKNAGVCGGPPVYRGFLRECLAVVPDGPGREKLRGWMRGAPGAEGGECAQQQQQEEESQYWVQRGGAPPQCTFRISLGVPCGLLLVPPSIEWTSYLKSVHAVPLTSVPTVLPCGHAPCT